MGVAKMVGKTHFVASLITSTADGKAAPYHRIAEVYFPSMTALEACLNSIGGQETAKYAVEISSGGAPLFLILFLISEVETVDF